MRKMSSKKALAMCAASLAYLIAPTLRSMHPPGLYPPLGDAPLRETLHDSVYMEKSAPR